MFFSLIVSQDSHSTVKRVVFRQRDLFLSSQEQPNISKHITTFKPIITWTLRVLRVCQVQDRNVANLVWTLPMSEIWCNFPYEAQFHTKKIIRGMNFARSQDFNCLSRCEYFELTLAMRNTLAHDVRCYCGIRILKGSSKVLTLRHLSMEVRLD